MNVNTVSIKQQQLTKGYFSSGTGKEVILIMGSCRVAQYVWYLDKWNNENGNRFTICSLDPFNLNWNEQDERVDYEEALKSMETHEGLLSMLASVDYFIHEFYANAGMFNVERNNPKTIYKFGLKPKHDICIPNWNNIFTLAGDIVSFDTEIRKKAIQDINVTGKLSDQTIKEIEKVSQDNLNKFYDVCLKTSFPQFAKIFRDNHKKERFFWNFNHTNKNFTLAIFCELNEHYLHLYLPESYLREIFQYDMFESNYTKLTFYDNVLWEEERLDIKKFL